MTVEKGKLAPEQVRQKIAQLSPWFHNLDLNGIQTAPDHFLGDYPEVKWRNFANAIPSDLRGKSVLDIGCNAGFYSMEMKRRGADLVVGIDSDPRYLAQARLAAEVSELEIEFHQFSVYDVARLGRKFDLVLFLGVFYHLRHPLLALDVIHEHVARDLVVFQSLQRGSDQTMPIRDDYLFWETEIFKRPEFPRMYFIEKNYSGDPTNWWFPNRSCVEAVLRSAGFDILQNPEEEVFICRRKELPESLAVYPATQEVQDD
jgi:tRNA (mo5U34)-methyltransferase